MSGDEATMENKSGKRTTNLSFNHHAPSSRVPSSSISGFSFLSYIDVHQFNLRERRREENLINTRKKDEDKKPSQTNHSSVDRSEVMHFYESSVISQPHLYFNLKTPELSYFCHPLLFQTTYKSCNVSLDKIINKLHGSKQKLILKINKISFDRPGG